jgi:UDP-N-acetylmuramoylalanine--D-glutamate ligase
MQLAGKHVVVVGLGASGIAAAKLALRRGARVTGVDAKKDIAPIPGVEMRLGTNELPAGDQIVVSPGVPNAPTKAIAEIEFGFQQMAHPAPVVAIGGTNGKSTVTTLVGAFLEAAGKKVFTGGNLGDPFCEAVDEKWDVFVLEVSSFQMERLVTFKPKVAVLLNITDDHLDRYPDFDAYAHAKGNCFERQTPDDVAVIPEGDSVCLREAKRGKARIVTFGPTTRPHKLQGGHNALNVSAAIAAVEPFGVDEDAITKVLATFEGLPHRMVLVAEIGGVRFYDDSKGTNVGASVTALRTLAEDKAVLIAGGREKGGSYAPLVDALKTKGRALVVIGEAADAIAAAAKGALPIERASSMDEAVAIAKKAARSGDAVLLSPACSSFDMFKDYKDRGDAFVRAVRRFQS